MALSDRVAGNASFADWSRAIGTTGILLLLFELHTPNYLREAVSEGNIEASLLRA